MGRPLGGAAPQQSLLVIVILSKGQSGESKDPISTTVMANPPRREKPDFAISIQHLAVST